MPSLPVQQIVTEIEAIEQQEATNKQLIQDSRNEIERLVEIMPGTPMPIRDLAEVNPSKDTVAKLPADTPVSFIEMASLSNEGGIMHRENRPLATVQKGYTHFRDGDVLFVKITPCMENGKGAVANSLTNGVGFGSTEFFVLRPNGVLHAELLYRFLQRKTYRTEAESSMTGASGYQRVPKTFLENTIINVPDAETQTVLVGQTQAIEAHICEAEARLSGVAGQKADVLKRHL